MTRCEEVTLVRIAEKGVVICSRKDVLSTVKKWSKIISENVKYFHDVTESEKNQMYALFNPCNREWRRCMLKFVRESDNVPVQELIDRNGVYGFDPNTMSVRTINFNEALANHLV